jgi:hypothetical protein
MTANPAQTARAGLYRAGYDGATASDRVTPKERERFDQALPRLVRRLHDAMLLLTVLDAHNPGGRGSGWPDYVHDFADKVAQGEIEQDARPKRFDPTRAQIDDFLPAMALMDGLRPIYHRVVFLRALGEFIGGRADGFSFDSIGDRYGKSGEWARKAYESVLVQAARRAGLLTLTQRGWAVLLASVDYAGARTIITTAADPDTQLRDLKAKSPIAIEGAVAIWTPGQETAKRLSGDLRKALAGRFSHNAWARMGLDDMIDLTLDLARSARIDWTVEALAVERGGPRARLLKVAARAPADAEVVRIVSGGEAG